VNSSLVIPAALLVALVAGAFVVGRIRVGDWQPGRDAPTLGAIALMGVIAVIVVVATPAVALVALPGALTVAGTYLLTKHAAFEREPPRTRSLIRIAAAGSLALGLFGLVIGFSRLMA
jgi:hypothetical protein